eukprot:7794129-Alexandrium_andersonii.AAC.1
MAMPVLMWRLMAMVRNMLLMMALMAVMGDGIDDGDDDAAAADGNGGEHERMQIRHFRTSPNSA